MLFKMLGIERAWATHSNSDMPKPCQLFVTHSRVLAGKVEEYFTKLMESLETASHSPLELAKLAKARQAQHEEQGLVDLDDETSWRNDLPDRFSLLDERHFPLFVTFDRVSLFQVCDSCCPVLIAMVLPNSSASFSKPI
jgi:hypothetical protein